ncbi:PD-(D/E)XK motif protein [Kaistella sp. BT6-1-3]|uniref:PD-(D/E)XK motif protein n=1 Tax=Kaistella yananensis TaxID=2989820 RepID=A0ABT3JNW4_9FLAO|nr:PD-(D/E)XK motif protein [Kaistella yananensis]MCW4452460.1 PD-(D/E)XK motif protein [Kaistella yananensis]
MVNIKSIWETQKPTGDIIIKTRIEDIPHLNCYAATNHITGQHLYIMSVSKNVEIPELKNYRFKGVEIFIVDTDDLCELNIYLLDNDLKDIFSLFIQNILEDIAESVTESEAVTKTLNVISKWKKLFDKINFNGLSIEQQKGLIGELLFINHLLDYPKSPSTILNAWTGPDFEDKDFVFGGTGIEIKLTSSKYPKIKITNEGQLDAQNLNELFLILYTVEHVKENGFTLYSLIDQTQQKLSANIDELKFFNERLMLLGYFEEDKEHYNKMFSLKRTYSYSVSEDFPKIIKSQLPIGIYNTSYFIELSAVENFSAEMNEITQNI